MLLAFFINNIDELEPRPSNKDASQNLTMAYNKFKYGIVSDERQDDSTIAPTFRREPLYPLILAGALKTLVDPESITLNCLIRAESKCANIQRYLKSVNLLIFLLIIFSTFVTCKIISGSNKLSYFASILVGLSPDLSTDINSFNTDLIAALPLLILSTFLYLCTTKNDWVKYAIGAGLSFGCLMLIKASYLYYGVFLIIAFIGLAWFKKSTQPLKKIILILAAAYLLVSPWMIRNYANFGVWKISGRGGEVLAIRAEFTDMNWSEYRASFFAYTPGIGEPILERFFAKEDYEKFDRDNPEGFYRRTKNRVQILKDNGEYEKIDNNLQSEAFAKIKQNWFKHTALIPVFAYRGAFVRVLPERSLALTRLTYFFAFLIVISRAIKLGKIGILAFSLIVLFNHSFYALFSHFITRYSDPLIPVLAVFLALCFCRFEGRPTKNYLS